VTVRTFRPEDAAQASAIDPAWTPETFVASHRLAIVAEMPSGKIGAWLLLSVVPPEAEILNIVAAPECRRQGLATALLREGLDRLAQAQVSRVWLEVRESNIAAQGLYRRFGFQQVGRRTQYYHHPAEDALLLETTLTVC
jgi:ribosomal-protein-alanine N-acetyltransferase